MGKFSENLARLMAEKGVSQVALAKRSGIKQPLISHYLHESKHAKFPSLKNLIALARALRCSLDELVGIEDIRAGRIELPEEILNMAHKFDKLDKRDQDLMMALALRLAELQRKKDEKDK